MTGPAPDGQPPPPEPGGGAGPAASGTAPPVAPAALAGAAQATRRVAAQAVAGGSRRLLARLREVMAGAGSPQDRLDKIVRVIAAELACDVCSCYVLRAGAVLELFATVGLNQEAVRRTRLTLGQGLVGTIAATSRPLALADARQHPAFVYRPETGEDPFQSLCGVPILRGGRVRGVLVIQTVDQRQFSEELVETLQTVAMVAAELVAGPLVSEVEIAQGSDPGMLPARLTGSSVNGGIATGVAVLHRPVLTAREVVAADPGAELQRLDRAVAELRAAVSRIVEMGRAAGLGEEAEVLETYRMFAEDRGWLRRMREGITQGLTAEAAAERVHEDMRLRLSQAGDSYLRERLHDLEDLTSRLLHLLAGRPTGPTATLPDKVILIARTMGPAELLEYDRARLCGLVLEDGSTSSHVAIVARALELPVVGRCRDALSLIQPLDPLIVDADRGHVYVRPAEDIADSFARTLQARARLRERYRMLAGRPAVTRDGERVSVMINAGLSLELEHLEEVGAEGVGLYRTEIPFMVRSTYPDVPQQTELYRRVLARAGERPVLFRTLDVGGDKRLPYFPELHEENPALGWRALRIGLDRPSMLRAQLRALVRAGAGRTLHVMFPLVATADEFFRARDLAWRELERARARGDAVPTALRLGVVVEVPALLFELDTVAAAADFLSVGSNDLMQYLYAVDRENRRVADRFDPLSPAMLRALARIVEVARAHGRPLSLCGQMASRPLEAMALIGLGFRTLSVSLQDVGPVKTMVAGLDAQGLRALMGPLLRRGDLPSLRPALRHWARDRRVPIEDDLH